MDTASGRPRKMMPLEDPGVVWLSGLVASGEKEGERKLLAHFSRRESLAKELEHGLALFDEKEGVFRRLKVLGPEDAWAFPDGHSLRDGGWVYFANPFPVVRVRDDWQSLADPAAYEALAWDPDQESYRWQKEHPPVTQKEEAGRIASGAAGDSARYRVRDEQGELVEIHRGSVRWNPWLKAWLLVGNRFGGKGEPSLLGEVYVCASARLEGPWEHAVKVATHPDYTYYNPVQFDFQDEQGGRVVYFQGTYSMMFSGNKTPVPRYDYNQLLYRLDLEDVRQALQLPDRAGSEAAKPPQAP
jgi:hypothetical protein